MVHSPTDSPESQNGLSEIDRMIEAARQKKEQWRESERRLPFEEKLRMLEGLIADGAFPHPELRLKVESLDKVGPVEP